MNGAVAPLPDVVRVLPLDGALGGTLRMPGDKSVSHRALLLGALCAAPVRVTGAATSHDVLATAAALRRMGVTVDLDDGAAVVNGPPGEPDDVLDCGNSGTAMRLLAGVCAGLDGVSILTGDASLRRRPMDRVAEPLRRMGASVDGRHGGRLAPLVVRGGALRGIHYLLPVASAQVKSAVLLAGLAAEGTTSVEEPGPTRDHTERMLGWLGAEVGREGPTVWVRQGPLRARELRVPGDPSSAAFWLTAAAMLPGSDVTVGELCLNPTRLGILDVLEKAGAQVRTTPDEVWSGEPVGRAVVRAGRLDPVTVAGDLVVRTIDELPVLAVAAAVGGGLELHDAAELRVKESDRIEGIARLLHSVGGRITVAADGFVVPGGQVLRGGRLDSGGDHRIAMAGAVAALAATGPVTIGGFAVVATSYPSFLDDLAALGGRWET